MQITHDNMQHHVQYRGIKTCWGCVHPNLDLQVSGWIQSVSEGLTKAFFSGPYNQTSHVSGERGEPWAACNDQHIPGLSGIPAVKSLAALLWPTAQKHLENLCLWLRLPKPSLLTKSSVSVIAAWDVQGGSRAGVGCRWVRMQVLITQQAVY